MRAGLYKLCIITIALAVLPRLSVAQCFVWNNEGTPGFSAGGALFTSIASDPSSGTPYIAYMDENAGFKATVKKFTSGVWADVGLAGFSAARADYTSIAVNNFGNPYVVYMDENALYQATVKKFNGTFWENIGIPGFSAGKAEKTSIALDASGTPYVSFIDWGNSKKATVMKFDGATWVNVGTAGFSADEVTDIKLAINSAGVPYVVFQDWDNSNKATVMRFNGTSWVVVGVPGFSDGQAAYTSIAFSNDTPFVVFSDWTNGRRATAMKFDGLAWVAAGTPGISPDRADFTEIVSDAGGGLYISYVDWFAGDEATVVKYTAGNWSLVGAANFSTGSTSNNTISASPNGTIYTAYTDGDVGGHATVMKFNNNIAPVTGTFTVCTGSTTTLSDFVAGGTWSSSNNTIASVGSATGVVTGNAPGTATITYTHSGSCGVVSATAVVTVNGGAGSITGSLVVCTGATTTLSIASTGGSWTSSTPSVAGIGPLTGVVTGVAAGTTVISYVSSVGCSASAIVTASSTPAFITGPLTLCAGTIGTLNCVTAGGTWSSDNLSVATISSTGVVSAGVTGTSVISYTMPGGCYRSATLTVSPNPPTITGTPVVCATSSTTLANANPGGIWSTSNASVASVVSTTGVVVGVAAGTANISYYHGGCYASIVVTVNTMPTNIIGATSACVGSTAALSSTPSGGTWSSSDVAMATVSASGVVTGVAIGNPVITYGFPTGCYRVLHFSVGPAPGVISGSASVCEDASTTLVCSPAGGIWSSGSASATIGTSSGIVTGVTAGTADITYSLGAGCQSYATVTVQASPAVIAGPSNVCTGSGITLTSSAGGTWSSFNPLIASVDPASGVVTGMVPGATYISYTYSSGCHRTKVVTVVATPAAATITGTSSLCVAASASLSASEPGGIWSITTGRASVSTSGIATGVAGGPDTVKYSIPSVCGLITSTHPVTVNALPSAGAIAGGSDLCVGQTMTLTATVAGGTWNSSNIVVAVVSPDGVVSGIVAGTATIRYRVSNACGADTAFADITVNPLPAAGTVSGSDSACPGDIVDFASTLTGGTWSTSDAAIATISATGNVTAVASGAVTVSYIVTNVCGADTATASLFIRTTEACEPASVTSVDAVSVSIFPNPSKGTLHIATPEAGILSVSTIDGREVARFDISTPATSVTLPDMASGFYMCRFTGVSGAAKVVRLVYER